MGDLWYGDIEDADAFSDRAILQSIRALITAQQRESTILDYKRDVSEKDNWSHQVAAFANTAGGIIIFGVECNGDVPVDLVGFNPQNVEIRTKITNTLISRIQPRPLFNIRVVKHDLDNTKEVAVLRIAEGIHPPYMHSKNEDRDIYVRDGSRKVKADYLQLNALFSKRGQAGHQGGSYVTEFLSTYGALLNVHDPELKNVTPHYHRIVIAPDDSSACSRLTAEVEQYFKSAVQKLFPAIHEAGIERTATSTCFTYRSQLGELRFALRLNGSIGFSTPSYVNSSNDGKPSLLFMVDKFCSELASFLCVAALFFQRLRYYSTTLIHVSLNVPPNAQVFRGDGLFIPALNLCGGLNGGTQVRAALQPTTEKRLQDLIEMMVNDLGRAGGSVTTDMLPGFVTEGIRRAVLASSEPAS